MVAGPARPKGAEPCHSHALPSPASTSKISLPGPKVFNFRDKSVGDAILKRIGEFRKLLDQRRLRPRRRVGRFCVVSPRPA